MYSSSLPVPKGLLKGILISSPSFHVTASHDQQGTASRKGHAAPDQTPLQLHDSFQPSIQPAGKTKLRHRLEAPIGPRSDEPSQPENRQEQRHEGAGEPDMEPGLRQFGHE